MPAHLATRRSHRLLIGAAVGQMRHRSRGAPDFGGSGEPHGGLGDIARHHLIDQPQCKRPVGGHRHTRHHQFQRVSRPDQARQTLRPSGTRQQTQIDFGQPQPGPAVGDAVMTGHGDFQPAAQHGAMQGRHHRLRRIFDPQAQRAQTQRLADFAKFGNVGSGRKTLPLAPDHHGPDAVVAQRLIQCHSKARPHRRRNRVDRRMHQTEHQHIAAPLGHHRIHSGRRPDPRLAGASLTGTWTGTTLTGGCALLWPSPHVHSPKTHARINDTRHSFGNGISAKYPSKPRACPAIRTPSCPTTRRGHLW